MGRHCTQICAHMLAPIQGIIACTCSFRKVFLKSGLRRAIVILMRQVLNVIEAGKLLVELKRRGIKPSQQLRVVVESIENDDPPMTAITASGGAFD